MDLTNSDEQRLGALREGAVSEAPEERRDLSRDAADEAPEDAGLTRAIAEGGGTATVSREEAFTLPADVRR